MDQTHRDRPAGAAPRVDADLFRAWVMVYEYQKARLERTYQDFREQGEDLRRFFFGSVYLHPDQRARFEKRDMAFVRISRNWLFRRLTTRELHEYLDTVIRLQQITDDYDLRVARNLLAQGAAGAPLEDGAFGRAYTRETTRAGRQAQIQYVLKTFELCNRIVNELPLNLEQILRYTPRAFLGNAELVDLCVQAHRTFSRHGARLDEYAAVLKEREAAYIDSMFGKEERA